MATAEDRTLRWIAAVDARQVKLLRCIPTRSGWRLEPAGELHNHWEADHERGRPSLLGRGPAPAHVVAPGRQQAESMRRFVRDVSDWLQSRIPAGDEPLIIMAPPRLLGALRRRLPPRSAMRQVERDVAHLRPAELASHPAITRALDRPA